MLEQCLSDVSTCSERRWEEVGNAVDPEILVATYLSLEGAHAYLSSIPLARDLWPMRSGGDPGCMNCRSDIERLTTRRALLTRWPAVLSPFDDGSAVRYSDLGSHLLPKSLDSSRAAGATDGRFVWLYWRATSREATVTRHNTRLVWRTQIDRRPPSRPSRAGTSGSRLQYEGK